MNRRDGIICYVLVATCLLGALITRAADSLTGSWTITHSDEAGKVLFALIERHHGGNSNHESDWPTSAFVGLDFTQTGKHDVHFTITRDAGRFDCEGYINSGEGAGTFHFYAEPKYVVEMNGLGFDGIDPEKQYAMATMDVSLAFAKQMKAEKLRDLDTDKLVAFRIFNVNSEFIEALRKAGLPISDSDKLVAFRIHGVTPEMVTALKQSGYNPDEDTLVAMRIHGATPEWIAQLKHDGYDHVDLEKLIAFRIHGVSPEFIERLQKLGYQHPEPDQLVAMRIHGVTPDYIADLRARGMQNLSIDQLVSLRIHGIN